MSDLSSHFPNDADNLGHTGHDLVRVDRQAPAGCPSSPLRATLARRTPVRTQPCRVRRDHGCTAFPQVRPLVDYPPFGQLAIGLTDIPAPGAVLPPESASNKIRIRTLTRVPRSRTRPSAWLLGTPNGPPNRETQGAVCLPCYLVPLAAHPQSRAESQPQAGIRVGDLSGVIQIDIHARVPCGHGRQ